MSGKVFVDTDILIYAHDLDAGQKNTISADILRDLWKNTQMWLCQLIFHIIRKSHENVVDCDLQKTF